MNQLTDFCIESTETLLLFYLQTENMYKNGILIEIPVFYIKI